MYFAQWLVIEKGVSDLSFNLAFTVSALALLFTVPLTGSLLDKSLRRITGIRYTTMLTALFYSICAIFAINNHEILSLVFFTLGLYAYLLSFTFYTPLLNDIAPISRRGRVSGYGIAANYAGQFAGLLIALPFSNGAINFFGASARAETLLPSIIIFFVLSLPMLVFFREPKKVAISFSSLRNKIKDMFAETKHIMSFSSVAFLLLAYFLFNDAILTASNNFPIFLEQVWHVSDNIKTYILLGILITSALGGVFSGMIADRFGHKRTLLFILFGWLLIFPLLGLLTNFTLFVIVTIILGFWFGANWTVSRSLMSRTAPEGKHNLAFSYFGLAERASSFVGPIVWGLIVSKMVYLGDDRYRYAVLAITAFIMVGLIALYKVKDDRAD